MVNSSVEPKNTTEKTPKIKNSPNKEEKVKEKIIIFFNAIWEITSGLNKEYFKNPEAVFSKGKIVLEKNIKIAPTIIEEKITLSSFLNKYPINIPIKINVDQIQIKIKNNSNEKTKFSTFKTYLIPKKIKTNCKNKITSEAK